MSKIYKPEGSRLNTLAMAADGLKTYWRGKRHMQCIKFVIMCSSALDGESTISITESSRAKTDAYSYQIRVSELEELIRATRDMAKS